MASLPLQSCDSWMFVKEKPDRKKKKKKTGMILINLQKAFDTVDYEIFLQKLTAIRFIKITLQ